MGGKTATSTQQVAVPPQVLAQYQSVNNRANQTANTPFQQYQGEFVAPVNAEQTQGISGTNAAANEAQPYFGAATGALGQTQADVNPLNQAATGLAAASAQQVNPTALDSAAINQYMSPYLQDVVGSEAELLNQNNQQQQAGQLGNAITSGAFGGDRTGIAAANLAQQQSLANASIYSNLLNQGYNTALGTAQQQQGVNLSAQQANRAALASAGQELSGIGQTTYGEGANTATTLAGLGTGAQTAGLQGAQAQIAAGTVQQQTQQAQDTALYNQFLQQQSYPFQVDQFLANIAEGTGALSGSTTTTQQPGGFFSDERLKEDMEVIGKTFDGQPIYRYRMRGDPREQIGLSAQKVEKKHPEAVGLAGGYRFVDYGRATEEAANRGHFYTGGVTRQSLHERRGYAYGGGPDDSGGLGAVLAAQQNMYAPRSQGQRNIPNTGASHQLAVAQGTPAPPPSGSSGVQQAVGLGKDAYQGYKWAMKPSPSANLGTTPSPVSGPSPTAAGTTTNFEAAEVPGTTTTFDAGLGAADTSAAPAAVSGASDAAATGAGEVAAGSAAEGAAADAAAGSAAGAATGAVAAGAADAAATEAAALAAEYAATYAAAAAVAAKRGGRIKFAGGGTPYELDGEYLDIPDEQQSNAHLQSPGPLVKQPTGLQTAMKMGDPNQWEGLASSMSSNTALATGGVAGRRGYDDGGPTEDDDPGDVTPDTPVVATDNDRGAGLAPAAKSSLWSKIKDHATAENVIPLLTGLAAMGTAPTRSPGVALAAGLGAGAQSYLGTRRSLAETAQEQAKTRGIDIANQLAAMKNQAAKDYLNPTPSVTPYATPDPVAKAQDIDQQYRQKYFVQPWLPSEQAAMKKARGAAIALGTDEPVKQAQVDRDQRILNQTNANQNAAQAEADRLYGIATDPNADTTLKQAALAKYNAVHQWTGDTYVDNAGTRINSRTGAPAIGVAAQQLSPQTWASMMRASIEPVRVPQSDGTELQVPIWRYAGASSPEEYARRLASAAPPPPPSTGVPVQPPQQAPTPVAPVAPVASEGSVKSGVTQSPIALAQQKINLDAVERIREAGDQAPNNRNINQQLLQLSAATQTGPATATVQKLAAVLGLPSGSRYQEINAYLDRQAASQAAVMGVPHTNAGLAASQTATGTTEYTPKALQEKVKYADALNSGTMAYREGLDKAIGTGGTQNLQKYQPFRSAWARNFDPDIYRVEDAQRRGAKADLDTIRTRLGSRGMKALAKKSANLRLLEEGVIPP